MRAGFILSLRENPGPHKILENENFRSRTKIGTKIAKYYLKRNENRPVLFGVISIINPQTGVAFFSFFFSPQEKRFSHNITPGKTIFARFSHSEKTFFVDSKKSFSFEKNHCSKTDFPATIFVVPTFRYAAADLRRLLYLSKVPLRPRRSRRCVRASSCISAIKTPISPMCVAIKFLRAELPKNTTLQNSTSP